MAMTTLVASEGGSARSLRTLKSPCGEEWEEVACPVCGGTESDLHLEAQDRLNGAPDVYRIVRCRTCEMTFVNPRPTFEALVPHYKQQYLSFATPDDYPWFMRAFAMSWGLGVVKRRLSDMEKRFGRITPETEMLDVGCGLNYFAYYVTRERGAKGMGVDLNDKAVKFSREKLGISAVQGTIETARLDADRFDVVTMMQYMEHEGNPRQVLAEVRRVLKPRGHLVIEIPDATGWPARFFKARWSNLDLPRHLVYFSEGTLRRALAAEGFELISYNRFGLPLYTGTSVYFSLQRKNKVVNAFGALLLAAVFGILFLPFLFWMREFGFAVARKV